MTVHDDDFCGACFRRFAELLAEQTAREFVHGLGTASSTGADTMPYGLGTATRA